MSTQLQVTSGIYNDQPIDFNISLFKIEENLKGVTIDIKSKFSKPDQFATIPIDIDVSFIATTASLCAMPELLHDIFHGEVISAQYVQNESLDTKEHSILVTTKHKYDTKITKDLGIPDMYFGLITQLFSYVTENRDIPFVYLHHTYKDASFALGESPKITQITL